MSGDHPFPANMAQTSIMLPFFALGSPLFCGFKVDINVVYEYIYYIVLIEIYYIHLYTIYSMQILICRLISLQSFLESQEFQGQSSPVLSFFCSTTIQLSPAPRLPHGDDFSEFSHENDHLMVKLMLQLWLNSPFYGPQIIGPGNPTCYQLFQTQTEHRKARREEEV